MNKQKPLDVDEMAAGVGEAMGKRKTVGVQEERGEEETTGARQEKKGRRKGRGPKQSP